MHIEYELVLKYKYESFILFCNRPPGSPAARGRNSAARTEIDRGHR